jgi:HD-GYP domain-containing protein (c-di-GMP phosphodiesterase class II)
LSTLVRPEIFQANLFLMDSLRKPRLYREANLPFTATDRERLSERGVSQLYISQESVDSYREYLTTFVTDDAVLYDLPPDHRATLFTDWLCLEMQRAFAEPEVSLLTSNVIRLAGITCKFLSHPHFSVAPLMRALRHDNEHWTHSTNVGLYAGLLAQSLGYTPKDIAQIVAGGFLHDYGKIEISNQLRNLFNCSAERQTRAMLAHPTTGFRNLSRVKEITAGQLMMVYQHHERLNRKGYPVGLPSEEIHPWAKICSVVNAFEGLTTGRKNRRSTGAARALSLLKLEINNAFDAELLECWTETIQPFSSN